VDSQPRLEREVFENEVRRIARELWPAAQFSGAAKVGGRERDGVFETEECVHLLEATTSRSKAKAEEDIGKLVDLADQLGKRSMAQAVKCWFVTQDEPTADQRKAAEGHRRLVNVLSFSQFQSRLVDANAYLSARDKYKFGSIDEPTGPIVDPSTGKQQVQQDYYIEAQLIRVPSGDTRPARELVPDLLNGERVVLLGDYGAGKSMTLRFLYQRLRALYMQGKTPCFPVYVNLRDHMGQTEPSEILERHARTVGLSTPSHLVRAWRAGYVCLLLDGFDEVATASMQGLWRKLQTHRYGAMKGVRSFISEHPGGGGIALAGRAHFFDSDTERRGALGLDGAFAEYRLGEFSEEQIGEYLAKRGVKGVVPQWLPSRPLLVAYLASRDVLSGSGTEVAREGGPILDPAEGWDYLLGRIAAREAKIEAGIDGATVRRILERLSTKARAGSQGLGPLAADSLVAAFQEVCGYAPDEKGMTLLQRLPGLGVNADVEETRSFIDEDFVDACRAGDVARFLCSPYSDQVLQSAALECGLGSLAVLVVARKCVQGDVKQGQMDAAVSRARSAASGHLLCDLVRVAFEVGVRVEESFYIRDLLIPEVALTERLASAAGVQFQECFLNRVEVDSDLDGRRLPRFIGCYIGELEGRVSERDLPPGCFVDCIIENFGTESTTTDSVLALDLPLGVRVLLTMLKKLYERRGSGRRENALYRGLDHRAQRLVPDILKLLQREGLATSCRRGADTLWLPDRKNLRRVGRIVASPASVEDRVVALARDLK
jgi:hypothetical protein